MGQARLNIPLSNLGDAIRWADEDIQRLAESAVSLAARNGLAVEDEDALKIAEAAGARVDRGPHRMRFSEEQIADTIAKLAADNPPQRYDLPEHTALGIGDGASTFYNRVTGMSQVASPEVLAAFVRMAEGLDAVASVEIPVQIMGSSRLMANLESYAIALCNTGKPSSPYILAYPEEAPYLYEMARLAKETRRHDIYLNDQEYVRPGFAFETVAIKRLRARVDQGFARLGIGTMAIAGYSAPVTMAGLVAAAAAEILAAVTLVRMLFPHVTLYTCSATGCMDMATGNVTFSSPRTLVQQLAMTELFRRAFDANMDVLTCYRDANEPGMQACYEFSLIHGFWRAAQRPAGFTCGHLGNGNVFSPTQVPLDIAMARDMDDITRPFEVTEETLGLEAATAATAGHLMDHPFTLEHFREELPLSALWPRGLTAGAGHAQFQTDRLLAEADASVLKAFERCAFAAEPDFERELQALLDRAADKIGQGPALQLDKVEPAWPW